MFGFNRPFISGRTPVSDPRNPAYDDSRDDAICDEAIEGSLSMRHAPAQLLRALADWTDAFDTHADAIRELLMPLYAERQSMAMKAMHAEFSRSAEAQDVAELALEREFSR
jgi:hypothetical protein